MREELINELNRRISTIVSDGDWDGIVATSILLIYAKDRKIEPVIRYPHPRKLKTLSFDYVVSVEITPTKTKITNSVIFDHHEKIDSGENIWIFDSKAPSVAWLVSRFLDIEFDRKFLEAINAIDQGNWRQTQLSQTLFKAFQIDPSNFPRMEITYNLVNSEIEKVISWAEQRAKLFEPVMKLAQKLMSNVRVLLDSPKIVYFTYEVGREEGARRIALLELEDEYDIVIALGERKGKFITGTVATKKGHNLRVLFEELRKLGYNAGGRENVGGFQALEAINVEDVIKNVKEVLTRIYQ